MKEDEKYKDGKNPEKDAEAIWRKRKGKNGRRMVINEQREKGKEI